MPLAPEYGSKVTGVELASEDVVVQCTAGGGGWGDPRERPREQVRRDVELGYVSETAAQREYGVNE